MTLLRRFPLLDSLNIHNSIASTLASKYCFSFDSVFKAFRALHNYPSSFSVEVLTEGSQSPPSALNANKFFNISSGHG